MLYRINPPETTPEYDEWQNAQDEKESLLKKASEALEPIPFADVSTYDELDDAIVAMAEALKTMTEMRDEYARLEELFPAKEDPGYL